MRKNFILISILSTALIAAGILVTFAMAHANSVSVEADVVNVRSGPGLAYDVTSQVRKNDVLQVIGEENKWYKVRLEDGNSGWVASWLVKNTSVSAASNSIAVVSSEGGLNVREKPSTDSAVLGMLNTNDQVNVVSEQNGWAQIQYQGRNAWVSSDYITIRNSTTKSASKDLQSISIRENETNIRNKPDLSGSVLEKADSGETYEIEGVQGDWYQVKTSNGSTGYVANWVVDISSGGETPQKSKTTKLSEATIVLDPGHGGNDPGAKGDKGTVEKSATLKTAKTIRSKLESAGAKVVMTRNKDEYVSLRDRNKTAAKNQADVFISIHFDSVEDSADGSVSGQTTYYYKKRDKELANTINDSLGDALSISNRGARVGDYYVVRENEQPALLLELGYLSSRQDEDRINSSSYRNQIADAVTEGLANYFTN